TVTFAPAVGGGGVLNYQWLFNGTNLPAATNATLTLSSVSPAHAGSYRLVLTNISGALTSAPGILTITCTAVTAANLNGTWSSSNSPYIANTGGVVTNLTVQPGVTVMFGPGVQLEIQGPFTAVGTSNSPIQFSPWGNNNWAGIYFNAATGALQMTW